MRTRHTLRTMIRISYISSAAEPMSKQDLLALLQECRENNAVCGVTGMLQHSAVVQSLMNHFRKERL